MVPGSHACRGGVDLLGRARRLDAGFDTLRDLAQLDRYRTQVLFAAARAVELTDDVRNLLEEIVRVGTKSEAVSATRALCGYRVARIDEFDPAEQRRVKETCARARGELFYWLPRDPGP